MPHSQGISSNSHPELNESLSEDLCSGFLRPEKMHQPQSDMNPRTLDLELCILPRDHHGRLVSIKFSKPRGYSIEVSIKLK